MIVQHFEIPKQPAPVAGATRMGMVFQPTRSVIDPQGQLAPPSVEASGFVVTIQRQIVPLADGPDGARAGSAAAALNTLPFSGEPLQLIGTVWLGENEPPVDADKEVRHWMWWRHAHSWDPARIFFFRLDLETLPALMLDWPPNERTSRCATIEVASRALCDRLRSKAFSRGGHPEFAEGQLRALDEVAALMERCILAHFCGDRGLEEQAFLDFAAGRLRLLSSTKDPRIRGSYVASDADSANVLMFAELALAMIDRGGADPRRAEFWRTRVHVLACMQELYLQRWDPSADPACFKDYGGRPPPLNILPSRLIEDYRRLEGDVNAIENRVRRNLSRVAAHNGCFG